MDSIRLDDRSELLKIEQELTTLIGNDKSSWVKIYNLMELVEREGLFQSSYKSYTAWVNSFATRIKVHVSLLWNRKKAGKMYSEYARRASNNGKNVPAIEDISVSPDSLILVEKISCGNDEVADDLTEKVLAGELGRSDLKNAWQTVRAKNANSVRVNAYDKPVKSAVAAPLNISDEPEQLTIITQQNSSELPVTAQHIVLELCNDHWLANKKIIKHHQQECYRVMTEFRVDTGTSHHSRRLDALILETETAAERDHINLHGIEIKVSESDLCNDHKMQEYTDFVDYFWIAIPEKLLEVARSIITEDWGILTFKNGEKLKISKDAKRLQPDFRDRTLEIALIKKL